MSEVLHAGAAERVITPPVGAVMVGWATRAAGDALARAVRDAGLLGEPFLMVQMSSGGDDTMAITPWRHLK